MTKKDYVKFAKLIQIRKEIIIKSHQSDIAMVEVGALQADMADIFAHDNERFDRQGFYDACEPKKQKEKVQVKDSTCVLCDYGEVHEH